MQHPGIYWRSVFISWLVGVLLHTVLASAWLTHFFRYSEVAGMALLFGFVLGIVFSFPAPFLLFLVVYSCLRAGFKGRTVFLILLLGSQLLALIAFLVFNRLFQPGEPLNSERFLLFALVSAAVGIISRYRVYTGGGSSPDIQGGVDQNDDLFAETSLK